ncbi:hypothetical protein MT997_28930 [Paenibacillus sp. OVF10]|nr:hypothetical protein MT997_28930 [Paenibacillus sp. OVF10]
MNDPKLKEIIFKADFSITKQLLPQLRQYMPYLIISPLNPDFPKWRLV